MNGSSDRVTTAPGLRRLRPAGTRSGRAVFALHLAEMLLVMLLGMLVLGGAAEGALRLNGGSLSDTPAGLHAAVMAAELTVPMVLWMRYRGHPVRHNVEMAASMVAPTALVIALHSFPLIFIFVNVTTGLDGVPGVMIPAMVSVMLWRYEHYSRSPSRLARSSRSSSASAPTSSAEPIPTPTAPASMNARALAWVTPPTATRRALGKGPRTASNHAGPSKSAGKTFTAAHPSPSAV